MSISAVSSLFSSSLQQLGALNSTPASLLSNAMGSSATSPTGSQGIPSFSDLMTQLQQEATSDPSVFKQQTAAIASNLSAAAQSATGTQAAILQGVASEFQTASQSGNLTALGPNAVSGNTGTQGASGHHHHHHHSSSQDPSQTSSTSSSDIMSLITASQATATASAANQAYVNSSLDSSILGN